MEKEKVCTNCNITKSKFRSCKSHKTRKLFCSNCRDKCHNCSENTCLDHLRTCKKCKEGICKLCFDTNLKICASCKSRLKCAFCEFYVDDSMLYYCTCCSEDKLDLYCAACITECVCGTTGCGGCGTVNSCNDCGNTYCRECMGDGECKKCKNLYYCNECLVENKGACYKCRDDELDSSTKSNDNESTNLNYVLHCRKGNTFNFQYSSDELCQFMTQKRKGNSITTTYNRKDSVKRRDLALGDIVVYSASIGGGIMVGRIIKIEITKKDLDIHAIVLNDDRYHGNKRGTINKIDCALIAKVCEDGDNYVQYNVDDPSFEISTLTEVLKLKNL